MTTRIPKAGDIVWVDLDPVKGSEQAGRRPALVLTDFGFNVREARSIVCPITRNLSDWPTKFQLPSGMKTSGAVLVDQVRSVDRSERSFRYIETSPPEVLVAVRAILGELLQIDR